MRDFACSLLEFLWVRPFHGITEWVGRLYVSHPSGLRIRVLFSNLPYKSQIMNLAHPSCFRNLYQIKALSLRVHFWNNRFRYSRTIRVGYVKTAHPFGFSVVTRKRHTCWFQIWTRKFSWITREVFSKIFWSMREVEWANFTHVVWTSRLGVLKISSQSTYVDLC